MKLAEFQKVAGSATPVPGGSVEPADGSAAPNPAEFVTSTTPSGIEVFYSWAPRRHYKLRKQGTKTWGDLGPHEWQEVPSVTNVLSVLDKSGALTWWGMKVGIDGLSWLQAAGRVGINGDSMVSYDENGQYERVIDTDGIVQLLTEHKLTVNHVKDKAANRGVNVHGALEAWVAGVGANPADYPETERGYIEGLIAFEHAISFANAGMESELMVGSLEHQYAGRFDLVLTLDKPVEVVTKIYPKKKPRVEEIPAGRYLLDLKTSKRVYDTHYLQLEAYEHAAVECGYAPTDYRGVVHVTEDGRYELALNKDWCFADFLSVRSTYQVMNEREALRILREELDAKEVA